MKTFLNVFMFFALSICSHAQNGVIIDHNCINLSDIPSQWINAAKNYLFIGYGHTSHGTQIASGMDAIESYYTDGTFNWSHEGGEDQLHLFEGSGYDEGDLRYDVGSVGWDDRTRDYLNANPTCNVIIWSWCGQLKDITNLQTHYLDAMAQLETEYPSVTFVYMTGHLEGLGPDGSLHANNQQIRDYCIANNKFLFDFADIEKYDPDALVNYQTLFAADDCYYDPDGAEPISYTQNWADNWVSNNPDDEMSEMATFCTSCAHSSSLNCIKKGIAAWYLWARLAGWDGNTGTVTPITNITISSDGDASTISNSGGTLQLSADILPANANNKNINWSIQNGTGQASISTSGLVTAIADGTVTATATAADGSGISDDFAITISNQTILVTNISISSNGDATSIATSGGTLQLSASVLPANAANPTVEWSVENGTGQASITQSGLITAITNGSVIVTATTTDGTDISDNFSITLSSQVAPSEIVISSQDNENVISTPNGTLQMYATLLPEDAAQNNIEWEIINVSGTATINENGLVQALNNGIIYVVANSILNDEVRDYFTITIDNQSPNSLGESFRTHDIFIKNRTLYLNNTNTIKQIRIIDLNGIIISQENALYKNSTINLSGLPAGIYIVHCTFNNDKSVYKKLFVPLM